MPNKKTQHRRVTKKKIIVKRKVRSSPVKKKKSVRGK